MNIQYYADDGTIKNLGDNELQHWKYIKKIKSGSGWRYFYTPEEVQAYYNEQKKVANNEYKKVNAKNEKNWKEVNDYLDSAYSRNGKYARQNGVKGSRYNDRDNQKEADSIDKKTRQYENKEYAKYKANKVKNKLEKNVKPVSRTAKKVIDKPVNSIKKDSSERIDKGRSKVEKKLKKAKKTAKSEAKGAKRAANAIRGKGKYAYDGWGNYYDYRKKYKPKKSGKIEKSMIKAYRKTHPNE